MKKSGMKKASMKKTSMKKAAMKATMKRKVGWLSVVDAMLFRQEAQL